MAILGKLCEFDRSLSRYALRRPVRWLVAAPLITVMALLAVDLTFNGQTLEASLPGAVLAGILMTLALASVLILARRKPSHRSS